MPAPAMVTRQIRRQVEGPLSVPFVYGGVILRGLWRESDEFPDDAAGFDQPQHRQSLLVMTEDGPFTDDSTLVCDGTTYAIRRSLRQINGVTTRLILTEVTS